MIPELDGSPGWRLREMIVRREVSPREVTQHALDTISARDSTLHCFVTVAAEQALDAAARLESRGAMDCPGPLFGIPISIKDQWLTAGIRSTGGSRVHEQLVPQEDATAVARIRAAGGVIVGKTNTPEFGLWWRTRNLVAPESRNPWDLGRSTGGSSGGAAASVAAGMTSIAVGSDCAGSTRLPSAFCGVFGILPTGGRVSRHGAIGGSLWFTGLGPITRDLRDAMALLQVVAGEDPLDATTLRTPPPDYASERHCDLSDVRCAWWSAPPGDQGDDDRRVVETARRAALALREAGAGVEDRGVCFVDDEDAEAFRCINEADRYGTHGRALLENPATCALLTPQVAQRFKEAARISGGDYAVALRQRFRAIRRLDSLFSGVDVLLSPTVGFVAPVPPDDWDSRPAGIITYTYPANYCGLPAASVPCGFVDGLPVAVQVMAAPDREPVIFRIAAALQRVFDWTQMAPPLSTAAKTIKESTHA